MTPREMSYILINTTALPDEQLQAAGHTHHSKGTLVESKIIFQISEKSITCLTNQNFDNITVTLKILFHMILSQFDPVEIITILGDHCHINCLLF
jgi:hypothetical protein